MNLIPEEELKRQGGINFAPLVDFLFLVLAVFAILAVTRTALFDSEVSLVKVNPSHAQSTAELSQEFYIVNLSITEAGKYKWLSEMNEYTIEPPENIIHELLKQQGLGLLPKEREKIKVLLHIDKNARWEPIAQLIFCIRSAGFAIHPVYKSDENDV